MNNEKLRQKVAQVLTKRYAICWNISPSNANYLRNFYVVEPRKVKIITREFYGVQDLPKFIRKIERKYKKGVKTQVIQINKEEEKLLQRYAVQYVTISYYICKRKHYED